MTKRKTEEAKRLTKLARPEWRGGLPQCSPNPDSEIGIQRERQRMGISRAVSNEDLGRVRAKWSYDPITGLLTALSGKKKGQVVGSKNAIGYLTVNLYNTAQLVHRIGWLIHFGALPDDGMVIDHKNGDQKDNRLTNLRVCRHAQNIQNHKLNVRNTSGVTGVCKNNRRGGWDASIAVFGKSIYLGTFSEFQEAVRVRKNAEIEYHGEFARSA